jgi:hypothetical protein
MYCSSRMRETSHVPLYKQGGSESELTRICMGKAALHRFCTALVPLLMHGETSAATSSIMRRGSSSLLLMRDFSSVLLFIFGGYQYRTAPHEWGKTVL